MSEIDDDKPGDRVIQPEVVDNSEFDEWAASVEFRLGRLRLTNMTGLAVALVAAGIGVLAMNGLKKLAIGLNNVAGMTQGLSNAVFPQEVPMGVRPVDPKVSAKPGTIDETPVGTGPVAEPAEGPATEVSDEIRKLLENDPISPADLLKAEPVDPTLGMDAVPDDGTRVYRDHLKGPSGG